MIPAMSETLLRCELQRPIAEELRSRAPLASAPIVLAVILWWQADEVARRYSDFWGIDPPVLPDDYWWGVWLLVFAWVAIPAVLFIVRVRREPVLNIGTERIASSYSTSSVRAVDTRRVSEIRLTNRELRFFVSDGLAPHVPLSTFPDGTGVQVAQEIARRLDVPVFQVSGPFWRRRKEPLDFDAMSTDVG